MHFFTDKTVSKDDLKKLVKDKKLLFMKQTHSDIVEVVDENYTPKECDAMITKDSRVALVVVVADCNPVIIKDSKQRAVGVAHAGRVGSYKSIVKKTILKMHKEFGLNLKDLEIYFGPSIKRCCYEVGSEVIDSFEEFIHKKNGKTYLDLIELNLKDLNELGVKKVEVDPTCTCCNKDYFSYRRDKTKKRFFGVVSL